MQLFYREFGQGQPLIILHGLFGMSDNWVSIAKRLAARYHVFIPDLRNHGQSPHAEVQSYEAMTDDLAGFVAEHCIENPILAGHSMGGKVAMSYALCYKEAIEKLIVIDISPRQYPERETITRFLGEMLAIDLRNFGTRLDLEIFFEKRIPNDRERLFVLKNIFRRPDGSFGWRINLETLNQHLPGLFAGISSENVFRKPTLFVKGGSSDYIAEDDMTLISRLFPCAAIKTIPGATHWVHADAPEELFGLISRFLEETSVL